MKVGIDVRATQTPHRTRGVGRYVFDVIEGLATFGGDHEYVLFVAKEEPISEPLRHLPPNFHLQPVPGQFLQPPFAQWLSRIPHSSLLSRCKHGQRFLYHPRIERLNYEVTYRHLVRAFENAVNQHHLDVVHLAAPVDSYVCPDGDFNCRRVATLFDVIPILMPAHFLRSWPDIVQIHYRRQVKSYEKADVVVTISDSVREDATRVLGLDPSRVVTVHCGTPSRAVGAQTDNSMRPVLAKFGIDGRFFVFCSSCDFHKNCEGMIRAYKAVRDAGIPLQLVMVTPRDDHFPRIEALLRDLRLTEKDVVITGRVSDEELAALYANAIALVSPSFYEGFGLPALEAIRLGTPVVASNRSSLPEVVGDAGLLFDPADVQDIARAMTRIATDPSLRKELAARCSRQSRLFKPEGQMKKLLDVYRGRRSGIPTASPIRP